MTPADILSRHWGYDSFRECQLEIIESVLDGRDTIGLLPTGGGKSITFQVPAMMLPGITVVVTPLISLMKDQVDNLRRVGIKACCLNSMMPRQELRRNLDALHSGHVKILYVAPEKIIRPGFLATLASLDVSLIVIDEAHCISQWGYDFRPSYLRLDLLRNAFPGAPMLALTASATPAVVADIADKLAMKAPAVFSRSFSRSNISYLVRYTDDKNSQLFHILTHTTGSAIVYTRSRRRTAQLAAELQRVGLSADFYHAGLMPREKESRQDAWMEGRTRIIVATNAFGMGIDKPDVRLVVHYDVPPSLEDYYQEAGRAGRDGLPSYAVLLAAPTDKSVLKRRVTDEYPPRQLIRQIYDHACVFLDLSMGHGHDQFFEFNFSDFCQRYGYHPRIASAALTILNRSGLIEYSENYGSRSRIIITAKREDFYSMRLSREAETVVRAIMRLYTGIFADYVNISEEAIAYTAALPREDVYQVLLQLSRSGVISYIPRRDTPALYFHYDREEPRHIIIPREAYEVRLARATERMEAMRDYAFRTDRCRVEAMLRYFGDPTAAPCGTCDICREAARRPAADPSPIDAEIAAHFEHSDTLALADVTRIFHKNSGAVIDRLRAMAEEGTIQISSENTFKKTLK